MLYPGFGIAPAKDVDETYPDTLAPEEVPAYLSRAKAAAYAADLSDDEILVTADTVVICDGEILGKPHGGRQAAIDMLRKLSGKSHTVVTGVTLTHRGRSTTFSDSTEVRFDLLTDDMIKFYVDTCKPYDKAGAYGIQEWIGGAAISGINGCFYNVMGLPLHALYLHLRPLLAE